MSMIRIATTASVLLAQDPGKPNQGDAQGKKPAAKKDKLPPFPKDKAKWVIRGKVKADAMLRPRVPRARETPRDALRDRGGDGIRRSEPHDARVPPAHGDDAGEVPQLARELETFYELHRVQEDRRTPGRLSGYGFPRITMRTLSIKVWWLLVAAGGASPVSGQVAPSHRAVEVRIEHGPRAPAFAGTLTLPARPGPHPAVLLVSPAGEHPRDELRRGGKHLADLAARLAKHGVASLRVDNRGVGGSRHDVWPAWDWSVSIEELTKDLAGHFDWLRKHPEIDVHRVGVLAHGDGTVPAARFAAETVRGSRRPAFVILLSASSARGTEDLARRQVASLPKDVPEAKRRKLESQLRSALEKLVEEGASKEAAAAIRECFVALGVPAAQAGAQATGFAKTFGQRWHRDYLGYRPRGMLRAVQCPALVVLAKDDERVDATTSAKTIEAAFRSALAYNAEVIQFDSGGHFLEPGDGRKVLRDEVVRAVRHFVSDATGFLVAPDLPAGVAAPPALVISDVTIVDVTAGKLQTRKTVIVRGGSIAGIFASRPHTLPDGAKEIPGKGLYLIPGLWDCHAHVSMWGPDAFARVIAHGVTTVRDMGGDLRELLAAKKRIDAGEILGPRLLLAGPFLDGDKPNDIYRRFVTNPADVAAVVTELSATGVDFFKVHSRLPTDVFAELARVAGKRGLAFGGHVPAGITPLEASDSGMVSIEHSDSFFSAMARAKDTPAPRWPQARAWWRGKEGVAAMRRIAENGTVVVPTLTTVAHFAERLGGMLKTVAPWTRDITRALHEAGVPLATGTDFARRAIGIEPGASLHGELELLVSAGLSPAAALRAATQIPARRFGGNDKGGVIAVGQNADMVLLRGDPLADIRNVRAIAGVVRQGAWLPRDRLDVLLAWARAVRDR